jgi:predicted glycogen debranching enzyme
MGSLDISKLNFDGLIEREWLSVNGLGGYASSTVCGLNTRKYHGLLVAAMSPPVRRMVLLSHVEETVIGGSGSYQLSTNEYPGVISPEGYKLLRAFSADPFPRWAYQSEGFTLEKSVRLLQGENTVCLTYTLLGGGKSVWLEARPLLALRGIHELSYQWNGRLAGESRPDGLVRIAATIKTPEIFFAHDGEFRAEPYWYLNAIYRREQDRGYAGLEDLWNPGIFRWTISPGQSVHLVCSPEPIQLDRVLNELHRAADDLDRRAAAVAVPGLGQRDQNLESLLRAASAFIVTLPPEAPSPVHVIGQYPWSAPTGRAALMAFAGLFLVPGRFVEGRRLLVSLAAGMQNGLIASEFPETAGAPLYGGADTSLWFVAAVNEYLRYTDDQITGRALLPALETIVQEYRRGTKLGITSDADGLVATRSPGIAASWMDGKIGESIVTPRFGRQVELNALWYNALRIVAALAAKFDKGPLAEELSALAEGVKAAFNRRFWNEKAGCCFDVVEDDAQDASIRPNQLLALSLAHPVLIEDRHAAMLKTVIGELLTPMGLRTLSPRDPAYQGRYEGSVVSRERAQHQGSAYPWLLGHLGTAAMRVYGRNEQCLARIRQWLDPCLQYLQSDGVGYIGELFDGNEPQRSGGAIASALSVAEILRCYTQEVLGIEAAPHGPIRIPPMPSSSPLPTGQPK